MRRAFLFAAVLGMAGCGDGGSTDLATGPSGPAYNLNELPNLYVASITPGQNAWGYHIATVRVCNNGGVLAGESLTRLEWGGGPESGDLELETPWVDVAACVDVTSSVLGYSWRAPTRFIAKADSDYDIYESNEMDNETSLDTERDRLGGL